MGLLGQVQIPAKAIVIAFVQIPLGKHESIAFTLSYELNIWIA